MYKYVVRRYEWMKEFKQSNTCKLILNKEYNIKGLSIDELLDICTFLKSVSSDDDLYKRDYELRSFYQDRISEEILYHLDVNGNKHVYKYVSDLCLKKGVTIYPYYFFDRFGTNEDIIIFMELVQSLVNDERATYCLNLFSGITSRVCLLDSPLTDDMYNKHVHFFNKVFSR